MQARQLANGLGSVRRASSRERKTAALVSLSIVSLFGVLWGLQKLHFDFGLLFNPCGFKQRTGWPCPACGMTTSVLAFARGQLVASFYAQPASALVCSLLAVAAFLALLVAAGGVYFTVFDRLLREVKVGHLLVVLLIIFMAGWAVTLARAFAAQTPG